MLLSNCSVSLPVYLPAYLCLYTSVTGELESLDFSSTISYKSVLKLLQVYVLGNTTPCSTSMVIYYLKMYYKMSLSKKKKKTKKFTLKTIQRLDEDTAFHERGVFSFTTCSSVFIEIKGTLCHANWWDQPWSSMVIYFFKEFVRRKCFHRNDQYS